jgi:hypothetical protein
MILEPVPHRHVVLSLPRRLRPFFRRRRRLTRLAHLAYETLMELLRAAAGTHTAVPGAVACLQSAGNLLDWHPHVHLLISWGLFRRDGSFIPVEETPDPEAVARLFRHKVLRMLLEEGAIEEHVVGNLLAWPHAGFGTHVSRATPRMRPGRRSSAAAWPASRSRQSECPWKRARHRSSIVQTRSTRATKQTANGSSTTWDSPPRGPASERRQTSPWAGRRPSPRVVLRAPR